MEFISLEPSGKQIANSSLISRIELKLNNYFSVSVATLKIQFKLIETKVSTLMKCKLCKTSSIFNGKHRDSVESCGEWNSLRLSDFGNTPDGNILEEK